RHLAHVRVFERPQLVGQFVSAEVELLVEDVDFDLAVRALASPLALRAASPDAPVRAVPLLLPAGRLDQVGSALWADVERAIDGAVGGLGHAGIFAAERAVLIRNSPHYLPQNPALLSRNHRKG